MITPDLRKIPNPDNMHIVVWCEVKDDEHIVKLIHPDRDKFKVLNIAKSLRYKTHSPVFGWGADSDSCKQTALAICLQLYPVSIALRYYKRFMHDFLIERFTGRNRIIIHDLHVPVNPEIYVE